MQLTKIAITIVDSEHVFPFVTVFRLFFRLGLLTVKFSHKEIITWTMRTNEVCAREIMNICHESITQPEGTKVHIKYSSPNNGRQIDITNKKFYEVVSECAKNIGLETYYSDNALYFREIDCSGKSSPLGSNGSISYSRIRWLGIIIVERSKKEKGELAQDLLEFGEELKNVKDLPL